MALASASAPYPRRVKSRARHERSSSSGEIARPYATMTKSTASIFAASGATFETEFVCIPRPLERSDRDDGGPLLYRTRHRASLWNKGETPRLEVQILDGNPR